MNINNFGPFEAETWGTVSDWVMVVVTAATLYLIYKTLKSQTMVQRLQAQATTIENERFRIQHMPQFNLTVKQSKARHPAFTSDCVYGLDFQLNENDCKEFSIKVNKEFLMEHIGHVINDMNGDYVVNGSHRIAWVEVFPAKKNIMNGAETPIVTTCSFMDLVGNKYTQDFYIIIKNSEIDIKAIHPIRVGQQISHISSS